MLTAWQAKSILDTSPAEGYSKPGMIEKSSKVCISTRAAPFGGGEDIDLCPDALYLRLTGKTPEDLFPALKTPVDA